MRLERDGTEAVRFRSGDPASLTVTLQANSKVEKVAVVIAVLGEGLDIIFDTSSQRLGAEPFDLEAGQRVSVTFDLTMHLAVGTFHVAAYLYRYDQERELDRAMPAATFFVEYERDVRGAVNLYPELRPALIGSAAIGAPAPVDLAASAANVQVTVPLQS